IAEWNPGWQFRPEDVPMPVVLRWSTNPALGFPLRPFEVYRRTIKEHDLRVFIRSPQNVEGSVVLDWGLRELYVVAFQVSVTPGAPLTIEALNAAGQPIP